MSADQPSFPAIASRGDILAPILRDRILRGIYPPGTWLREVELRSEFDISNGPVRDALQSLVAIGLAEKVPAKGVRVINLTKEELRDLFELRIALLSHAAELAMASASDARLQAGLQVLRDYVPSGTAPATSQGGALSKWLLEACGNSVMQKVWEKNLLPTQVYINAAGLGVARESIVSAMGEAIEAIIAREAIVARRAIRRLNEIILEAVVIT